MTGALDEFADWLAAKADGLVVQLDIPRSRYVGQGIRGARTGLSDVLSVYSWKAAWIGPDGMTVSSGDWSSTKESLRRLRGWLASLMDDDNGSEAALLDATRRVVDWGGGARSAGKGADKFLRATADNGRLRTYLDRCRTILRDATVGDPRLEEIELMNSMLTKVHALLAQDGLPIYDSRVACALGCLVELYRRDAGLGWKTVPDAIRFPAIRRDRSVSVALGDAVDPGWIYYGNRRGTTDWVEAKLKARGLLRAVLTRKPGLYVEEGELPARMHAFEATLFMIGASPGALFGAVEPRHAALS